MTSEKLIANLNDWQISNLAAYFGASGRPGSENFFGEFYSNEHEFVREALIAIPFHHLRGTVLDKVAELEGKEIPLSHFKVIEELNEKVGGIMSTEEGYNGWSNRKTWNVALFVQNDEQYSNEWGSLTRTLQCNGWKEYVQKTMGSTTPDGVRLDDPEVIWLEIYRAVEEAYEELAYVVINCETGSTEEPEELSTVIQQWFDTDIKEELVKSVQLQRLSVGESMFHVCEGCPIQIVRVRGAALYD